MKTFRIYHSDGAYFLVEVKAASRLEAIVKARKQFPRIKGALQAVQN